MADKDRKRSTDRSRSGSPTDDDSSMYGRGGQGMPDDREKEPDDQGNQRDVDEGRQDQGGRKTNLGDRSTGGSPGVSNR
jgi:hypothetical protein